MALLLFAGGAAGCSVYKSNLLQAKRAGSKPKASTSSGDASLVVPEDAASNPEDAATNTGTPDAGDAGQVPKDASVADAGATSQSPNPVSCAYGDCWWSTKDGPCDSTGLPGPNDRPKASGDVGVETQDVGEIYLGWTQLRLGATLPDGTAADNAWQGFGLDLDGICTNSVTCPEQKDMVACHSAGAQIPYDGAHCRDNTFASLQPVVAKVPEIGTRFGLSEDVFNCALWNGEYNVILRITGYNGLADDPDVRVDLYLSNGLELPMAWSCPLADYRNVYPRWRASATWHIDDANLTAAIDRPGHLPDSMIADPDAYVRGGYLVMRLPDGTSLRLIGNGMPYRGFPLTVYRGLWVGNLYKAQDGTWNIKDGLAVGVTKSDDLIKSFREIGFCEGMGLDSFYQSMTTYVRENADMLVSGMTDPQMPCDAMSLGLGFEAAEVTPGTAGPVEPLIECCPLGKTDEECLAKCGDGKVSGDELCDTAIAAGAAGACPTSCSPKDACTPSVVSGSDCNAKCVDMPITTDQPGDGCCRAGANATQDSDCPSICGNGVVEPNETCDPSASCPSCQSSNACLIATPSGSANLCTAACTLVPVTQCKNGDNCCPSQCNHAQDDDCPMGCGDGVFEPQDGETCDDSSSMQCPAGCDDGDACTTDVQTGSAANCNLVCTHTTITQVGPMEGCCPNVAGANANTDKDCTPKCGNKVVESGEQCDDGNSTPGDGCFNCQMETPQQICMVKIGETNACATCNCNKCTQDVMDCYTSASAADNALCITLARCAVTNSCTSTACYCGTADFFSCLFGAGNGKCRSEVEAAAKTTDPGTISTRASDTNYPVGRANALGDCASTNCATECGF